MNTDSFKSPSLCNFGYLPSIMNILYVYLSLPPYYSVVIVKKEIASFLPKSVCFTACFFRLFLSFFFLCVIPPLYTTKLRVFECVWSLVCPPLDRMVGQSYVLVTRNLSFQLIYFNFYIQTLKAYNFSYVTFHTIYNSFLRQSSLSHLPDQCLTSY